MPDNSKYFWQNNWEKHLNGYILVNPRTGIFIKYVFGDKIDTVLEIACRSSRDSIYLSKNNYKVVASDYEENTISLLDKQYRSPDLTYKTADAFNLPFDGNCFDLTFHNGFFIYFKDEYIVKLLVEQARVTKKFILILVHNKSNSKAVRRFETLAKDDPLYDIRFFGGQELLDLINRLGIGYRSVKFLKFGGPMDRLYNRSFLRYMPNIVYPFRESTVPGLY